MQGGKHQNRLVENPAIVSMIPSKGKHNICHGFVGYGNTMVFLETCLDLFPGYLVFQADAKPNGMHILGICLDGRGEHIQIQANGFIQMIDIPGMMCPHIIIMLADLG